MTHLYTTILILAIFAAIFSFFFVDITTGLLIVFAAFSTSKYAETITQITIFALLGVIASVNKTLQNYIEGHTIDIGIAIANTIISSTFAVLGGEFVSTYQTDTRLSYFASFLCGLSGFATVKLVEKRVFKLT